MSKTTKKWIVTAASFVLVGGIIFGGVMSMLKWDFTKLSTVRYENNEYEILEDYQHISIITNTADIVFIPSEDPTTSVSCYEQKGNLHSVSVKDGTLEIEIVDTRKWYEYIGIHFGTPKITVHIPQGEYGKLSVKASTGDVEIPEVFKFRSIDILESTGNVKNYASALEDVKIKTTTGSISVEDASAGSLDLTASTGKVTVSGVICEGDIAVGVSTGKTYLSNIRCKNFTSSGSTGDISLKNVVAEETFFIKRSTGNVKFDGSDAAEIFVETETGDVRGSLLSDKIFIAQTDTGSVDVPKTATGGKCEITTITGDINISIPDNLTFTARQ